MFVMYFSVSIYVKDEVEGVVIVFIIDIKIRY